MYGGEVNKAHLIHQSYKGGKERPLIASITANTPWEIEKLCALNSSEEKRNFHHLRKIRDVWKSLRKNFFNFLAIEVRIRSFVMEYFTSLKKFGAEFFSGRKFWLKSENFRAVVLSNHILRVVSKF